jgi:hypothetical protein
VGACVYWTEGAKGCVCVCGEGAFPPAPGKKLLCVRGKIYSGAHSAKRCVVRARVRVYGRKGAGVDGNWTKRARSNHHLW